MSLWSDDHIQPERYKGVLGFFRWLGYMLIIAITIILFMASMITFMILLCHLFCVNVL